MKTVFIGLASSAVLSLAAGVSAFAEETAARHPEPAVFAGQLSIDTSGLNLDGNVVLTNFPVLVRLSEGIDGFRYSDFKSPDRADMMFTDDRGAVLPYEIQSWNPEGTSLVWVRANELSANERLFLYYSAEGVTVPNDPRATWRDYFAVWHLDGKGDDGAVAESGPHGLAGVAADAVTADESGKVGPCFSFGDAGGVLASGLHERLSADADTGRFTISCWARLSAKTGNVFDKLVFKKDATSHANGWAIEINGWGLDSMSVFGKGGSSVALRHGIDGTDTWYHLGYVYDGGRAESYNNGVFLAGGALPGGSASMTDNERPIAIGCTSNGGETWHGAIDEVRIYNGVASADRLRAECLMTAGEDALSYAVSAADSDFPSLAENPTLIRKDDGTFMVNAGLASGRAEVFFATDGGVRQSLSDGVVDGPWSASAVLSGLAPETSHAWRIEAVTEAGTLRHVVNGAGTFYTGTVSARAVSDAHEQGLKAGAIEVFRSSDAAAACRHPLTVAYALSGTAAPGADYEALSGTVTIPAGAASATVEIKPLTNLLTDADATVVLTPSAGLAARFGDAGSVVLVNARDPRIAPHPKRRLITVAGYDAANHRETLTDFRLLVRLNGGNFDYADAPDGAGLLFVEKEDVCAHEIDTWNPHGESLVWVNVPKLVPGVNTLALYYGGAGSDGSDAAATWDGYLGVWHMNETGDGAVAVNDSTANGLHGAATANSSATAAGKFGGARAPCTDGGGNGGKSHILVPNTDDRLSVGRPVLTVSMWFRLNGDSKWAYLVGRRNTDVWGDWALQFGDDAEARKMRLWYKNGQDMFDEIDMGRALNDRQWHKVTVVYDNSVRSFYLDGVPVVHRKANKTNDWYDDFQGQALAIGGPVGDDTYGAFSGDIDEVRILPSVACSSNRAMAAYRMDVDPAFATVGAEETPGERASIGRVWTETPDGRPRLGVELASGSGTVHVTYIAADGARTEVCLGEAVAGTPVYDSLATLADGAYYAYETKVVSADGETLYLFSDGTTVYNGSVALSVRRDAALQNLSPGAFRLVRSAHAETLSRELTVAYAVGGTAEPGVDYAALGGTATFAAGAAFVDIPVELLDGARAGKTVSISVAGGSVGVLPSSAELLIRGERVKPAGQIVFRATGYTGDPLAGGFPALVRLREGLAGFSHADCWFDDGSDVRFMDARGNVLPHEIDTWDPSGESCAWVRVDGLSQRSKIVMSYGSPRLSAAEIAARRTALWAGQTCVWHLHLAPVPEKPTDTRFLNSANESVSVMRAWDGGTAAAAGLVGGARRISDGNHGYHGGGVFADGKGAADGNGLNIGNVFTVSGWIKYKKGQKTSYDRIFGRKNGWSDDNGWEVGTGNENPRQLDVRGINGNKTIGANVFPEDRPINDGEWHHLTVVYNGAEASIYENGEHRLTGAIDAATNDRADRNFGIGNDADGNEVCFKGVIDEVRFGAGVLSAARVKADYETVANPDFWSASPRKTGFMLYVR